MSALSRTSLNFLINTLIVASSLTWCPVMALAAPLNITYPHSDSQINASNDYYIQLLELVLRKAGSRYIAHANQIAMGQGRAILQLQNNDGIDVLWTMTTRDREDAMQAIRIPIDKGLIGWRILLIKKNDQDKFAHIHTLNDLKKYTAGQGHDWPDTTILRANGLSVEASGTHESLFNMLLADRFQFLPIGFLEVHSVESKHYNPDIAVEPTLALHYPSAIYFFVNKKNVALAKNLTKGLEIAMHDGSFDKLFEKFNGESIKQVHLKSRQVIELNNSLLADETPLSNRDLWFNP
jgi:ABC-type amino acid transport substrate-binding protein